MRLFAGWVVLAGLLPVAGVRAAVGQDSWWARYEARVSATRANQPHFATPLVTTNPQVEQRLRADFTRQSLPGGQTQWNDGGGNGVQVIPLPRTEFRLSVPPFLSHSNAKVLDGFGDVGLRLKYRLYGSNEQHRNAIVSGMLAATIPTGKQKNGSCCAVLTPTLDASKGFGPVTLVSLVSGTLPVSNTRGLGRSVIWNSAAEVKVLRYVWPEVEINSTWFYGGKNDGKVQTFATPGLVVSRLPLLPGRGPGGATPQGGLLLTLGAGEQIALTRFNTYGHAIVLTGRMQF